MTSDPRNGERPKEQAVPVTQNRLFGSLRDALAAAGRTDSPPAAAAAVAKATPPVLLPAPAPPQSEAEDKPGAGRGEGRVSAAEAVREARGMPERPAERHIEADVPQTRAVRTPPPKVPSEPTAPPRTQLLRGKTTVKRTDFWQDPVVGWLVVVGGPGLGAFRAIYEGNNTMGRGKTQRIPIDFGDEAISNEEQAYIRYDSVDRTFLLVPNLSKTNIVAVNDRKPTGAVELAPKDIITMGRTQLVFVPFCDTEFDWSELSDLKG